MLHLRLLGPPGLSLGGTALEGIVSKKSLALLFYLATTGRTHSRDELASLFWYDMPDAQARKNLRNILPVLRSLLGSHLLVTRHTVGLNPMAPYWLDVETFRTALQGDLRHLNLRALREATALYGGDFLTGFYVQDAPMFEEWMIGQRHHLQDLAVKGLSNLGERYFEQGEYQSGLEVSQRLLLLEPWSEKAHQQQMQLLAAIGERDRALMQYELCRRTLSSEFGVEPTPETMSLYLRIKEGAPLLACSNGHLAYAVGMGVEQARPPGPGAMQRTAPAMVGMPEMAVVYGRESEARCLRHWVAVERCRLVMLSGGVGTGKTALTRYTVQTLLQPTATLDPGREGGTHARFEQLLWHSLREVQSLDQLLNSWLDHLGVPALALPRSERLVALLEQLRRRRCLLVLDDIERLGDHDVNEAWASAYRRLIEGIVWSEHQSCLLLVGRELPPFGAYFEATSSLVRTLGLGGLEGAAAEALLALYRLRGSATARSWLIEQYDGAPLFLHLAARTIQGLFHGDIEAFCSAGEPVLAVIRAVLDAEFAALDPLEHDVIALIATTPQPYPLQRLIDAWSHTPAAPHLLEALQRLQRRSLLIPMGDGFAIPRLVHAYALARARVAIVSQESRAICLPQPS